MLKYGSEEIPDTGNYGESQIYHHSAENTVWVQGINKYPGSCKNGNEQQKHYEKIYNGKNSLLPEGEMSSTRIFFQAENKNILKYPQRTKERTVQSSKYQGKSDKTHKTKRQNSRSDKERIELEIENRIHHPDKLCTLPSEIYHTEQHYKRSNGNSDILVQLEKPHIMIFLMVRFERSIFPRLFS